MIDLSEFDGTAVGGPPCWRVLYDFTPEQAEKLDAAIETHGITDRRVAEVATGWGFPLTQGQVGYHRRGDCRCD